MKKIAIIFLLVTSLRVSAQPTISALSAVTGIPGASITITGTNFNTSAANDVVYFGATRATVTSASSTSLAVTVPYGSTYMPVTVSNMASGLTAFSDKLFLPTYDNSAYLTDTVVFDPKLTLATGVEPYGIAIADIDGDGKADLAVVSYIDSAVYVYRNISSSGSLTLGSFAAPVTFTCGFQAQAIAIGDIDGDGKLDISVSDGVLPTGGNFSVLRNTSSPGTISFDNKVMFMGGHEQMGMVVGDIDGDGKPDVVLTSESTNEISLFHNVSASGSIAFEPVVTLSTGNVPVGVIMADIDGDGKADLVVSNEGDSTFYVYRNTSTTGSLSISSYAAPVIFPLAGRSFELAASDIDGDGKLDIVIARGDESTVSVFRNTAIPGSISSGSFATPVDFAVSGASFNIAMGDFNGDAKPDVIVENGATDSIYVLRNASSAGAISFGPQAIFAAGVGGWGIAVGDIDGDGKPDMAVANYWDSTITIFRNHPVSSTTETPVVMNGHFFEVNITPNPNNGTFKLQGTIGSNKDQPITLEITNMLGQMVYTNTATAENGIINKQISLSNNLANGMYLMNVKSGTESKVLHFVIEK